MDKVKLYEGRDGTPYEVALPLTSTLDLSIAVSDLGLPGYIDLANPAVRRAIAALWAAQRAPVLDLKIGDKQPKKALSPLLFGGVAVKLHCPSANKPNHPLNRCVKDIDFAVPKSQGALFAKLLTSLSGAFGSYYTFFITPSDKMFNALRGGRRYRVRSIYETLENGIGINIIDVFCDELPFRHTIKLRKDLFELSRANVYTIGLESLLLSKCQFIFGLPHERITELEVAGQSFRLLPYKHLRGLVAVGMELKDVKDVAALLLDHEIGEGPDQINLKAVKRVLEKDKGFALTVELNLRNLVDRIDILVHEGLSKSEVGKITDTANELLKTLPTIDKQWDKPWWNLYVETPKVT
ncbi:MAG: hypothetical protein QXY49_02440 [Thermofilaceae archaeon]